MSKTLGQIAGEAFNLGRSWTWAGAAPGEQRDFELAAQAVCKTMSKWQDISTAPKDGREFLAVDENGMIEVVSYAWNDSEERPLFYLPGRKAKRFSGWTPLPSPLQAQGESEERSDDPTATDEFASLTPNPSEHSE